MHVMSCVRAGSSKANVRSARGLFQPRLQLVVLVFHFTEVVLSWMWYCAACVRAAFWQQHAVPTLY